MLVESLVMAWLGARDPGQTTWEPAPLPPPTIVQTKHGPSKGYVYFEGSPLIQGVRQRVAAERGPRL